MKLNLVLLFYIPITFISCKGQNTHQTNNENLNNNKSVPVTVPAFGDTVPNLSDSIMVIYQDKMNNYWFGSRGQGVFRYDGKNLFKFTMKNGLVSNEIWGIQEDAAGNIYFDTQEGVSKFDGQTFRTLTFSDSSENEWKCEPGDLWFKGSWNANGPYRFDGKKLHHLKFPKNKLINEMAANFPKATWSPYGLYSLYKDKKGNIWFGTSNVGLYRFDGKNISWMYEKHLTHVEESGGSFGIRSILEDKDGKFWICNTSYRYNILNTDLKEQDYSLINYNREKGIENFKNPDGKDLLYFMSAVEDNAGNIWMVTYSQGVWKYDGINMTKYPVKDDSKEITLFSIYKDNHGDLWVGTHENGAYKFNGKSYEKFK